MRDCVWLLARSAHDALRGQKAVRTKMSSTTIQLVGIGADDRCDDAALHERMSQSRKARPIITL